MPWAGSALVTSSTSVAAVPASIGRDAQMVMEQSELDHVYCPERVLERQLHATLAHRLTLLERLQYISQMPLSHLEDLAAQCQIRPPPPIIEAARYPIDIAVYLPRSSVCVAIRPLVEAYMYPSVKSVNRFFPNTIVRFTVNFYSQPRVCETAKFVEVCCRPPDAPIVVAPAAAATAATRETAMCTALEAARQLDWKSRVRVVMVITDTPAIDNEPSNTPERAIDELASVAALFAFVSANLVATGPLTPRYNRPNALPSGVVCASAPSVMACLVGTMLEASKRARR